MPKLVLKKKAEVLDEFVLKQTNSTVTVGSEPGNDVVIADKMVSMSHMQIERKGNQYYVRDLRSAFGTFLNNLRVEDITEIRDGDILKLGQHELVFRNPLEQDSQFNESEQPDSTKLNDFWSDVKEAVIDVVQDDTQNTSDRTGYRAASPAGEYASDSDDPLQLDRLQHDDHLDDDSLGRELSEVLEQVGEGSEEEKAGDRQGAREKKPPYYLLAVYGPYFGKKYQLNFGETRIGRDLKLNDIVIRENRKGEVDPSISRRHATITYRDSQFFLTDKRSKSRSYLNQTMLRETDEMLLTPEDEIEIVSDQKSTIFRLVAEGNWDFSFPKRAGAWWLRYRSQALAAGTVFLTIAGLALGVLGWYHWSILTDVPSPFEAERQAFARIEFSTNEQVSYRGQNHGTSGPIAILANINDDKYVDLVATTPNGTLYAVDGNTKRKLWSLQGVILDQNFPFTSGDLNGDDYPDLVALTADAHLIAIDGYHGAEIWTTGFYARDAHGPPIIGDFDGDERMDVAITSDYTKLQIGYASAFNPDWVVVTIPVETRAPLSCADLDRDGADEILIGTDRGMVLIYDGTERRVRGDININLSLNKLKGSFSEDNQIRYPVAAADLNGDQTLDLVVSSMQGNLVCLDISQQLPDGQSKVQELWWASLGEAPADHEAYELVAHEYPFVLGDIDKDGLADVVAVCSDGSLVAYHGANDDGRRQDELWRHSNNSMPGLPVLFDFNADLVNDVLLTGQQGGLKIIDGAGGAPIWQDDAGFRSFAGIPLLADLAKNTRLDVVTLGIDGVVQSFKTNRRVPAGTIIWGQKFGFSSNNSAVAFSRSNQNTYVAAMILGLAIVLTSNAANFTIRKRRQRLAAS